MIRVLIVDDQIEVRRMLRAALETLRPGLSVTDIPSGEEALLMLTRQPFDLGVFDVRLAGISGLELMKKARQRRPDLKVILITGSTDPVMRQKIVDAGADDFFFKPVEIPDFINAVDYCVGQQQPEVIEGSGEIFLEKELEPEKSLLNLLSGMRDQIKAICILLIDQNGQVLARSGDLPADQAEPQLLSLAAGAVRISSEISGRLGMDPPQDLLCFSGKRIDLVLFYSGHAALAAVLDAPASEKTRSAVKRQAQSILDGLTNVLPLTPEGSAAESSPEPAEVEAGAGLEEEAFPDLDQFFSLASREGYEADDAQSFWELERSEGEQDGQPGEGRLSFDQARMLGLTPDDDL